MATPAGPTSEDLSELLTASVRRVAEPATDQGISLFYDYRGPSFDAGPQGRALSRVMDTLVDDAVAKLSSGCIFLSVDVVPHRAPGRSSVLLQIARTGMPATEQVVNRLITTTRPSPREARGAAADDSAESQARQACEELGGSLIVGNLPGQAHVVRADMLLPTSHLTEDLTVAIEQGLVAWLIGEPPVVFESLVRRLHRLGWKVRVFPTVARARAHWRERPGHPPDLVVAMERYRVSPDELCVLADDLPAAAAVFAAFSPATLQRLDPLGFLGRVKSFVFPLSPRELHQITVCGLAKVGKRLRMPTHATVALERRPRALLVEDNVINQLLCSEILQLFGFEVDIANNGLEAVQYCERELPAVVLMDLDMPVMDGLEATRRIRAMHHRGSLPYIPIVAATAKTTEEDRAQARDAGMDGFVPKPLDLGVMQSELKRVLDAP